MKVSLNWIKQFTDVQIPIDELVEKIGAQLGAVEEVINLDVRYQNIIVAKVVSCEKHPNADKLSVCWIDDGSKAKNVKRNDKGLVQVVCGAPNVAAGQLVAWLPPGATVPATFDKDPFVLEARELRGVTSNGMIASAKELALGDDHSGILVLDGELKPGDDFAQAFGLDDYIIDIENKMFTHRPDCFAMLGVAREIAGISGKAFKSPSWYNQDAGLHADGRKNVLELEVKNDIPKLVPRFCAVAIKDVKVTDSPAWLKTYLARVGVRPINNIVDLTNYIMLETAQPLHAYDYDKLKTGILGARLSREGEQLALLNGKTIKLSNGATVITDGQKPIGLAGVMGGADTEVDAGTKNIVLECANFDMNTTRRAAMEYGLFTDAATRFTKGQSPRQNMAVLVHAVQLLRQLAGGRIASKVIDGNHTPANRSAVEVSPKFINSRLGLELSTNEISKLLKNVEFEVQTGDEKLKITAPFWRTDLEIPEDIVEEVGRLYGYDHLKLDLPQRSIAPAGQNEKIMLKAKIRQILSSAGANEVLTYSFVNEKLLKNARQDSANAYHIRNALSPDLQYYRLSLVPSLLDKVHPNIKSGFEKFTLFEIGKGHLKDVLDDGKLPDELERVALVVASRTREAGAPYFTAKNYCDYLLAKLGLRDATYLSLGPTDSKTATYYEDGRAAEIMVGGRKIGRVGEFKQSVKTAFKLPIFCAGAVLDIDELLSLELSLEYKPLNKYPETSQDICLRTKAEVAYGDLEKLIENTLSQVSREQGYKYTISPIDIFQRENDSEHKQTTWHIILQHPERTLTTDEVNKVFDMLEQAAKDKFKAERI